MKNLFLGIGFCLVAFSSLFAQQDSLILLNGKVVNGSEPLYNVHILNISRITGTVTDYEGNFKLWVTPSDTINFSALGFKDVNYMIADTVSTEQFRVLVNMIADTILIKETVVMPWPANRVILKQAMLDQEKEDERVGAFAGFRENDAPPEEPEAKIYNPISFLYNAFNKKARQLKKIEKWRQEMDAYEKEKKNVDEKDIKY
ncbi:MAG: carboxypeptidase-like regulatory domain-containing protein [Chitinophagales bacterium]